VPRAKASAKKIAADKPARRSATAGSAAHPTPREEEELALATHPIAASRGRAARFVGVAIAIVAVIVGVTWYADKKPDPMKTESTALPPLKDGDSVKVFDPDYEKKLADERKAAAKAAAKPEAAEPKAAPEPAAVPPEPVPSAKAATSAPAPDAVPPAPANPPPAKEPAAPKPKPPAPPKAPPAPKDPAPPKPPAPKPPSGDPYE